jgi:hypothetical protein
VHPSWRDLVIAALADDPLERRRFLAHCGVDGAALALSLPLPAEDADWDALADGLHRLCAELDEDDAVRLLTVLADTEPEPEISALADLVARRLGARWRGRAVSVDALAAWAAVAARLPDPPEAPAAAATWIALEPQHAPRSPAELERFADWLRLAELLARHDPELLAGLGFPERYRPALDEFAGRTPRGEPPLEHELRVEALERLAELYPGCAGVARESAGVLRHEDELPDREWNVPQRPPLTGFPVERVLRDLAD